MKKSIIFTSHKLKALVMACLIFTIYSCDDEQLEDMKDQDNSPTGALSVVDQALSANSIMVNTATLSKDGWVVVHKDNGEGPVVPAIISEPKYLEAGTTEDIEIMIKDGTSLDDGEKLWVMLHTDTGIEETYEFDTKQEVDKPVTDASGNIIMKSITISSPSISAMDQAINGNTVVIEEVNAAKDGWIVIHNDNGEGQPVLPGIVGKTWVEAGINSDVVIELDNAETYTPGQKLFPMLHLDSPADMEYTFPENGDAPEVFGFAENNIIMVSFEVMAPMGTLEVADQHISQNTIVVPSAEISGAGWIVVHADNGSDAPVVPAIISEPVQIEAGMNTNVMVMLKEGVSIMDGDKVWVMLHTDNGEMGAYEFDGANGLDGPIMSEGSITMEQITIEAPAVMAVDQPVINNEVSIAKVEAAVGGWIVIHNDNGSGGPVLPGIIGKTWVEAGVSENVVIKLDETNTYTVGQKLFPMLHVDSPADMEYTFPDDGDAPEIFGFEENNIIVTAFTVTQ